jgi:hypothetical protein
MSWPPDRYEGTLIPPASAPAPTGAPASEESSLFDEITETFDQLYQHEPRLTRTPLDQLRAASTADLERLFKP